MPIKTYTVADGLLRDSILKIKQDSRGFLWFCSGGGISRFDGYAFTNFTTDDGLPNRSVNDFLETRDGTIWIATDDGLAKLNPKGLAGSKDNPLFTALLTNNPRAKSFQILYEDEGGLVWAGTNGGLYKLNAHDKLEAVDLYKQSSGSDVLSINTIIKDRRGAMWIGTELHGLFRIRPDGEVEQFTQKDGLPDINISILLEDNNGRIWVGLRPHYFAGLCLLIAEPKKNQTIIERHYTTKDGLPADWILDLYEDEDSFWVGTIRGLCRWQTGKQSVCKTYTAKNDSCDIDVRTITKDKDGNLWTGSRCGAKKWARYGFTSYNEADGLDTSSINSIFENRAGDLFTSTNFNRRAVSRFDGDKFYLVKPSFAPEAIYHGWGWKQTVLEDRAGNWWFPTAPGLLRFPKPARFEELATTVPQVIDPGTKGAEVFRTFEDSRGDVWIATIGTANELWRWHPTTDTWRDFTAETGFGRGRIGFAFVEDKSGNLWISTGGDDSALIRYHDDKFKIFTRNDGVPEGWMRDLYIDHAERLWIANPTVGLLRLDDVNTERLEFVRYSSAEGLASMGVSCITEDEFGRIYIGSDRGLDRLNPESGQVENFTTDDGLPSSTVEIAYRDRQNNLWFGTTNGLARFVPEPVKIRPPPNTLIMGLRVAGVARAVSILGETAIPMLELDSNQQQVTIDFLGLGTNLGEKLRYEYRLGESEWTPTTERTINFANLSSGEYVFEVRTVTADRIYSQPATVAFQIATPIWKRWWFISITLIFVTIAVYLFYKRRFSRLLEMERMRTRIAADLHDDIGANLTRISLLSEVAIQKSTNNGNDNLFSSIANIARESVASMNDIVWAIGPDHDRMLDLTRRMRQHAEEIFAMRDIELDFSSPGEDDDLKLSVGVRRDVLLIFKEAINNAARHSGCSNVQIDFRCENSTLTLKIKDNGKGFDYVNPESDGQGLRSMARRAYALGGQLTIESSRSHGTNIDFELPLPKGGTQDFYLHK